MIADPSVELGQSYFGTRISRKDGLVIERTDGETVTAKAVLNAEELSFYDGTGGRVLFFDPATGTYKFMGVLNVADKFVVDQAGNVTMKGSINLSDGSITWGGKGPVKYQFSASTSGPWHDMMGANDKYRRDSLDGGTSWGAAYQFKGEDGRDGSDGADGSDAQVPGYILNTYIDATKVESFYIRANKLEAVCPKGAESDTETGFILTGAFDKKELRYLRIDAFDGGSMPYVRFSSPSDATASWQFNQTNFRGILNFENADVQGLTATFA